MNVPDDAEEMLDLIRVKIDIYGLTMEDIEYFKNASNKILIDRNVEEQR